MGIIGNPLLLGEEGGGPGPSDYQIPRSLRFNSADSAYLNRTPSAAGNRKTWTWSGWVKLADISAQQTVFAASTDGSNRVWLRFNNGPLELQFEQGGAQTNLNTNAVYRDPSAWYHIVVAVDTTQATASNRSKIYVNGEQVTSFSTEQYPSQNYDTYVNGANLHRIGCVAWSLAVFADSYMADVFLIDGQALDPTSFGEYDSNNVWQPKEYTGDFTIGPVYSNNSSGGAFYSTGSWAQAFDGNLSTGPFTYSSTSNTLTLPPEVTWSSQIRVYALRYNGIFEINGTDVSSGIGTSAAWHDLTSTLGSSGTLSTIEIGDVGTNYVKLFAVELDGQILIDSSGLNSFHLDFSDNSTAAALGTDTSGNGNDWTVNNISIGGVAVSVNYTGASNYLDQAIDGIFGNSSATDVAYTATFTTPIAYNSLTVVYGNMANGALGNPASGAVLYVNGSGVSATGTYGTSPYNSTYHKHYTTNTPGTLSSLGISGGVSGSHQTGIYEVFVNGVLLQEITSAIAAAENDSLVDSPTNGNQTDTGVGGEVVGNYCTWNPLKQTSGTYSDGNLQIATSSGNKHYQATFGLTSGKWYWEVIPTTGSTPGMIGIALDTKALSANLNGAGAMSYYSVTGNKQGGNTSGVDTSYGAAYTYNDVIGVALDLDSATTTLTFYKNGSSQGVAFNPDPALGSWHPAVSAGSSVNTTTFVANFGQRPFAYTAPSGFKALCTANLPDSTIADGSTAMDVKLYTGNGSTQTISGLGFSPDLVWLKVRSSTGDHGLWDFVRGTTKRLVSNSTGAESTVSGVTAFNSDGFSLGAAYNVNNDTYVAWTWDAGSSTVSNTDGSITSQVRANPSAGFSIVEFTNPSSGGWTFGHGLNVGPEFFIMRPKSATSNWQTYHKGLSALSTGRSFLWLNSTNAEMGSSNTYFTSDPDSSVCYAGSGMHPGSAQTHIAYCFAPVDGYSSFGSYTGNGSANGPFVYTGFRPRWLLLRCSSISQLWLLLDSERDEYNIISKAIQAHTSDYEIDNATNYGLDFTSNGFKVRSLTDRTNGSGQTYIYAAFAEHPFAMARAR